MRRALAAYVRSAMQAYGDAARLLAPADQARMPLLASDDLTIIVVGTRNLHLLGTTERLPAPAGPEVAVDDAVDSIRWHLRFFDPVIIPGLGLIDESERPQPGLVRDALGVRTHAFHLIVSPGSGLTSHHAQHAGTGLAHSHAAAVRDYDAIAALAPQRIDLVREMRAAEVAGLPLAQLLLARAILPGLVATDSASFDAVRTELLAGLRAGHP